MFDPRCELVLHAAARAGHGDGIVARLVRGEMSQSRIPQSPKELLRPGAAATRGFPGAPSLRLP